jgi:hypothetical protein
MPADSLPHPLLAAEIDLPFGDGYALRRWSDRRSDHRANSVCESGKVGLGHGRQVALQGAKQMSERGIQHRAASSIEQRRYIPQSVARHEERDPVYMGPIVQQFLSERTKKGHFRRYFEHSPSSVRGMHAPDAVAGDPMIDGIALKVALSSCDTNGRRVGSAHRQSAQFPYMHLGRKSVSGRLFR